MRDDPGLDAGLISGGLRANYGIDVVDLAYLPIGHDMNAFVYRVGAAGGSAYFLKIRRGSCGYPARLLRALDQGVGQRLHPLLVSAMRRRCLGRRAGMGTRCSVTAKQALSA